MAKAKGNKRAEVAEQRKRPAPAKPAGGVPLIDTTFAVQAAAAMVGQKVSGADASGGRKESAGFKQLKEGLNQPHLQSLGKVLDATGNTTAKKSAQPFTQTKQVGHNQTFGADVNRTGVPRRTGG
jgi:hypothetical protein